ncbi:DASH complex subunit duo1 [Zygosaccharomyces mellis]|uniref:DASH complex subunit DUO1 n=1 Tax=Zygosaccharomyces mellis TaxID=42258 RepID=A0A4C2E483_9SACH|nr:DASH complex subunit duo1 [Zygosaccharomyces mellis]
MDSFALNKLIPQMFEEMRSNLGKGPDDTNNHPNSQNSVITTQSLLKELEVLDKIIPMVENVENSLKLSIPQHLERIHEICKSTNSMLDSWIDIQSQAGYINKLMRSSAYLRHTSTLTTTNGTSSEELLAVETKENEYLKEQLRQEQGKEISRKNLQTQPKQDQLKGAQTNSRVTKPGNSKIPRSKVTRSDIPSVTERLTRPTASSTRKMFR